jgi:hypothetical protein
VKHYFCILLLWLFCSNAFSDNDVDIYRVDQSIQQIMLKYDAKYLQSFKEYLESFYGPEQLVLGSVYTIDSMNALNTVRELQAIVKGKYAFQIEMNFNIGDEKDKIAIVTVNNQFDLLRIMKIQGNDFQIGNDKIIEWFHKWANQFEYQIVGVGIDFIMADILKPPKDYDRLAKEIYSMCPDVVDQGTGSVKELAREIEESKLLYFWWD